MIPIQCQHLTKCFPNKTAVDALTFTIEAGEKVVLLGANGAGKTTTMRLLLGLETPTAGSVQLMGGAPTVAKNRLAIGVTPQESDFIEHITVNEILYFVQQHYPHTYTLQELKDIFMLQAFQDQFTHQLSLGQKRRLGLALAFINKPKVVFLDEPTTGLDVESRQRIWDFIGTYTRDENVTLFLTTHYLQEAEELTDRVIYIQNGKIKSDNTKQSFKSHLNQMRVEFYCHTVFDQQVVASLIEKVVYHDQRVTLFCKDADEIVRRLVESHVPFQQLTIHHPNLEEAYLAWQKESVC